MKKVVFLILAAAFIAASPSAAQHAVKEGITFLDTQELKRIHGKGSFVLANTLSPIEFKEKRIAGSISIPLSHYEDNRVALPEDRETRVIFYCMGEK